MFFYFPHCDFFRFPPFSWSSLSFSSSMSRSDAFVGSVCPRGRSVAAGPLTSVWRKKHRSKERRFLIHANPLRVARFDRSRDIRRQSGGLEKLAGGAHGPPRPTPQVAAPEASKVVGTVRDEEGFLAWRGMCRMRFEPPLTATQGIPLALFSGIVRELATNHPRRASDHDDRDGQEDSDG